MTRFAAGTRVYLPFRNASGILSAGTVIFSDARRFRVAWDSHGRKPGESRVRTWHRVSEAARFSTGAARDAE